MITNKQKYYLANKDRFREWARKYRIRHKDKIRLRAKKWREDNREELRIKKSIYKLKNKKRSYATLKKYRETEKAKKYLREYLIQYRKKNPEKYKARMLVQAAVRKGELIQKPCEKCGSKKSEAHHPDYKKPLKVKWLCRSCHIIEDGRQAIGFQSSKKKRNV